MNDPDPPDTGSESVDSAINTPVPRLHRQTLIEMNLAAFTARRDAAHQRAVTILQEEMVENSKEKRCDLYTHCLGLLDEAILATRRSQAEQDTRLLHCMNLLRDTVGASLALVRHELTMAREAEHFAKLLGPEIVAELQTADDVFSRSEMNILDCIDDLLKFGEPIRARDTQERMDSFSEDDRRRYELTFGEYHRFYRTYDPGRTADRRRH